MIKLYKRYISCWAGKEYKHTKLRTKIKLTLRSISWDLNKFMEEKVEYDMVIRRRKLHTKIQRLIDKI